uniref:TRM2 tRNA methyltransferase 2B n=1 Tax=Peromyscus maniculatus bairdii TaxID=230844 RepID=A0A8C8U0C0_PERMB
HNPRLFLSRVGFFSKSGLLPWYTTNPPDLSQSFWGRAHKGDFTSVTVRKHPSRQQYQKKQRHFSSLEDSWQERLADVVTPLWRLSYEEQLKPIINGYRNKSTFSVNRSPDGNPKTVGYYLGTWKGQLK